jgi:hypothetical protein
MRDGEPEGRESLIAAVRAMERSVMRSISRGVVPVAVGAVLLVGGCGEYPGSTKASSPSPRTGNFTFGLALDSGTAGAPVPFPERIPGISRGVVSCGIKDGKTMFVVWADRESEGSECIAGSSEELRCRSSFGDIAYECVTSDGETGTCWIGFRNARWPADATRYDLADGSLFLISTQGAEPRIKQLQRDLSSVKSEIGYFEGLAKSDAEIRDFFIEQKAAE